MNKAPVVFLPPRRASSLTGSDWRLGGAAWGSCSFLLPSAGTPLHRFRTGFTRILGNGNHQDRKCGPESISAFSKENEMRRWKQMLVKERFPITGVCVKNHYLKPQSQWFLYTSLFCLGRTQQCILFYFTLLSLILFYIFRSLPHWVIE